MNAEATTKKIRNAMSALEAKSGGVLVRWSLIGTLAVLLCSAIWRYADARWTACEASGCLMAQELDQMRDRALVLEQQRAADQQRADERHNDLKAQLAQIQTQLMQIQVDLRKGN
jgi:hypothetical protein